MPQRNALCFARSMNHGVLQVIAGAIESIALTDVSGSTLMMRTLLRLLAPALLVLLIAAPALADALVVVEVQSDTGDPVDGRVTLKARGSEQSFSCTTRQGKCQIPHVPGGRYTVQFQPKSGEPPTPRSAMIPPGGRVTLHVAAR